MFTYNIQCVNGLISVWFVCRHYLLIYHVSIINASNIVLVLNLSQELCVHHITWQLVSLWRHKLHCDVTLLFSISGYNSDSENNILNSIGCINKLSRSLGLWWMCTKTCHCVSVCMMNNKCLLINNNTVKTLSGNDSCVFVIELNPHVWLCALWTDCYCFYYDLLLFRILPTFTH